MPSVNYNERSWAIDLISAIKLFLSNRRLRIKNAGGENTIRSAATSLFPDVLLFGDSSQGEILQGWELKMPDTPITDEEFINNAAQKAETLNLESFLLWNAKSAVLYKKEEDSFQPYKYWPAIESINSREEVQTNSDDWKGLLYQILEDLNGFFESGALARKPIIDSLSLNSIIDVILENTDSTVDTIRAQIGRNARLDAEINNWWRSSTAEYTESNNKYKVLARVVLTDWVIKVVFAHILKRYFDEAKQVDHISEGTTIQQGIAVFNHISDTCNFWNIFNVHLGQKTISENAWKQLLQLNGFLIDVNIEGVDISILHQLLQSSVVSAKRKAAGQFTTSQKLSELLVRLCIEDKTKTVLDPCCGTGTIISEAYKLKEEYERNQNEILETIWASDKYAFPLQLATLTLSKPSNIGRIMNIFREDVINLETNKTIEFKDPNNGNIVTKRLPAVDYIVSNLPFVQQEDIRFLNPDIYEINDWIRENATDTVTLSGKSDLYVYLPFYLYRLLSDNARIVLVLSNAWLGTTYGRSFIELLQWFYEFEQIVVSGKGKWFDNADIVTTLVFLKKKAQTSSPDNNDEISYSVIKKDLINEIEDVKELSENLLLRQNTENISINTYSRGSISSFESLGLPWSSYFADLNWINEVRDHLIPASDVFEIRRGERRGWNDLFYPPEDNSIEEEYIEPVVKNLRGCRSLTASPNKLAFCCSRSKEELRDLGHSGALSWINRFENETNGRGEPLPEVLQRARLHWYEMSSENMADFAAQINYDKSLFIAKLQDRAFVDQRLIGFTLKNGFETENRDFLLALLNNTISMFFIEALGFGRGLGALDLSKDKVEESFRILDPNTPTSEQKAEIIEAFHPLLSRERMALEAELEQEDRINFEQTLFRIYGIEDYFESVKEALLKLFKIRFAVNDS